MRKLLAFALVFTLAFLGRATPVRALSGTVNFVVLRVSFSDFPSGARFTAAQTQTNFNNIATLWGNDTSYGNITLAYQTAGPFQMPKTSPSYIDVEREFVLACSDRDARQRCGRRLAHEHQLVERLRRRRRLRGSARERLLSRHHVSEHPLDFATRRRDL